MIGKGVGMAKHECETGMQFSMVVSQRVGSDLRASEGAFGLAALSGGADRRHTSRLGGSFERPESPDSTPEFTGRTNKVPFSGFVRIFALGFGGSSAHYLVKLHRQRNQKSDKSYNT